ncbi:MAG: dihydroneopterin aldolase [Candidatus Omnitrophica bacterium]|nr:dihydroneopterin aldolase [Candidatus Omnitrophota bacterium]
MAMIQIKDLAVRTIIGIQDWEREKAQDVLINISLEYDAAKAAQSDDIQDAVDYKAVKQAVIRLVESSRFNLVEKMAAEILAVAMSDQRVEYASVTIDKPNALRFARSVSLTMSKGTRMPS